ncbi:MAG: hypothetical protein AB7T49_09655 [Oligoflexales bacterium]
MLLRNASLVILTLLLAVGCKKEDDDKDDDTTDSGTLVLMPEIDLSCGDSGCFGTDSSGLRLEGESQLQAMRMFAWIMTGFPSKEAYETATGGDESAAEVMPQDGMSGYIEGIRADVVTMVEEHSKVSSCQDAPTSGTISVDDATLTWTTPLMEEPNFFGEDPSDYEKAILYESGDGTVSGRFEFICDQNRMAITIKRTNEDDNVIYYSFFYNREEENKLYTQFFINSRGFLTFNSEGETLNLALDLAADIETTEVSSHVTRAGKSADDLYQAYRYATNANLADGQISFYTVEVGTDDNSDGLTLAEWEASEHTTATTVEGGVAASTGSGHDPKNGCADGWDAESSTLTAADLCDGLDLTEAPAPALEVEAEATMDWVINSLGDAVEGLIE